MALPVNQLGSFRFVNIMGDPAVLREQLEVISRPGVDNVALRKTGHRGEPFQIRSQVDVDSLTAGRAELGQYRDLIGAGPQTLSWFDVVSDSEAVSVYVLDVIDHRLRKIGTSTGGFSTSAGAWLEVTWVLILTDI